MGLSSKYLLQVVFFPTQSCGWWAWLWLHAVNPWRAAKGTEDELPYTNICTLTEHTKCHMEFTISTHHLPMWQDVYRPSCQNDSFLFYLSINWENFPSGLFFCTANLSSFKYFLKTPFSWTVYWCLLIFYGYSESCHITPLKTTTESNCRAEECPLIKYRPKLQFSVHVGTRRRRTS